MALLPVDEAKRRLLDRSLPVTDVETVALADANGRVLAEPVIARLTQPPFDASAMDGYALKAQDASTIGSVLSVIGTAAAGHPFAGEIGPGEAVRIFTGAPVPPGADTILIQEDAETLEDGRIRTKIAVTGGKHIRPRGQDFAEGDIVLSEGVLLDYARLTVAAATNHPALAVYRRPKVAVLATGDELLPPGKTPAAGQIIASNTFGVGALARDNGAEVLDLGIVPDRQEAIEEAIGRAQAANVDVLVTIGGASVGDHDLVQKTLKAAGMELDFWRIAMRPGKPMMVGALGDMQVLGLPGNPVASLVCSLLFLEPLLRRLAHLPERKREAKAVSARDLAANDARQDYLRARLVHDGAGNIAADPFDKQDSSMMKIFADSDALIVRPPHAPALTAGDACPVLLLRP
ncbi:molybdopterin molybdenumtransferase MoeA [Pseudorhizobium endolithicum]|uniref:Molybdopterin molybdenumtransferase n=1 Tax=Pseudorhizobium endolithicum TaxID=1191678 RepID=A0ABM8PXK0_9HYPH|nr:gephyrin-like molybdotransferase Glp [Pseudorhizobium endolithicum]CAD7053900.1 molybdopterin molybdenumtransferase MoeA [Pseudorhizobium endolithicum]